MAKEINNYCSKIVKQLPIISTNINTSMSIYLIAYITSDAIL